MRALHSIALATGLTLALPLAAAAQPPWAAPASHPAWQEGYARGERAGEEDARRNRPFDAIGHIDYRRGDAGYRSQYGHRELYKQEFRRGFDAGYRSGYAYGGRGPRPPVAAPRWDDRRPWDRPGGRVDSAFEYGFHDGYEAGFDAGLHRHRYDPVGDRRYRNADRGYERGYGSRAAYENRYRDAWRDGYARGYADGRSTPHRPWWWPF